MTANPEWLALARQIVAEFEGCRLTAYPDPDSGSDPWTIGYGHTGPDVTPGLTINQAQADRLLLADLAHAAAEVFRLLPMAAGWLPQQQAAMVSFVFNVGSGLLETSTLRRRLLAGEDPASVAKAELPRWNNPGSSVMEGLSRRRKAEVALFTAAPPAPTATAKPPQAPNAPAASGSPVWPKGMIGPKIRPPLQPGDHHLISNDVNETMTAWTHDGHKLWSIPCLCRGQGGEAEWQSPNTDTPPGLYKVGSVWRDYERLGDHPASVPADLYPYGWFTLDLVEMEGQERRYGRAGIAIHGGGSVLGPSGCWQPFQPLVTTHGCIRAHNADLRDKIVPLLQSGTVWVSVLQEAG
jgi:GH24 family phage-related lysozyme (muramidase)